MPETEDGKSVTNSDKWHILHNLGDWLYIMVRHISHKTEFSYLYVHTFKVVQPHFLIDAEKYNIQHQNAKNLVTVADKLRYYRYQKGLLQREVADYAGINRTPYCTYEENLREVYPADVMVKIAELFEVDVEDLLDEYNLFLYRGQGNQIKALRKGMGLTQGEFGNLYGVGKHVVGRWERDEVLMFRGSWEKYKRLE